VISELKLSSLSLPPPPPFVQTPDPASFRTAVQKLEQASKIFRCFPVAARRFCIAWVKDVSCCADAVRPIRIALEVEDVVRANRRENCNYRTSNIVTS
jgi:hypothetical protein